MCGLKWRTLTTFAGVVMFGAIAGFCSAANAATARSTATIDWSTFAISTIGDVSIAFDAETDGTLFDRSLAIVNIFLSNELGTVGWTEGTFAQVEVQDGGNETSTVAYTPASSASDALLHSESEVLAGLPGNGWASSEAVRGGNFTAFGNGVVVFSFTYELFTDSVSSGIDINGATASAHAGVFTFLANLNGPSSAYSSIAASVESVFDPRSANFGGPSGEAGTMTIELFFHDGDRGQLVLGAATESIAATPVPLPPAACLLVVALLTLPQRRMS